MYYVRARVCVCTVHFVMKGKVLKMQLLLVASA